MSSNNGSERTARIRKDARDRYGLQLMSGGGVLQAALAEPCCPKDKDYVSDADKEDQAASAYWDRAAVNAIRVMCGLEPLETYT